MATEWLSSKEAAQRLGLVTIGEMVARAEQAGARVVGKDGEVAVDVVAGVTSTLGGMVDSVLVSVGQAVNQGDRLVIIEAMKMKTPMIAHRAGTVTVIAVKAGEAVDAGQLLVSLA